MFELDCAVSESPWGKIGYTSVVALFAELGQHRCKIDPKKPYAELTIGTQASGPSRMKGFGLLLSEYIERSPKSLGLDVLRKWGRQMPFVCKLISVERPTPMVAYLSDEKAQKLRISRSLCYTDPNEKHEVLIALTKFEALAGFRKLSEVKRNLQGIPELRAVIKYRSICRLLRSSEDNYEIPLKRCIQDLFKCPPDIIEKQLENLVCRIKDINDLCTRRSLCASAIVPMVVEYPRDPGTFCIYFLNYIVMETGEALSITPGLVFTYLKGDGIVCTTNSKNIIPVALTETYRDLDTFFQTTIFQSVKESDILLDSGGPYFSSEFGIDKMKIPVGNYIIPKRCSGSVIIVLAGEGRANIHTPFHRGQVFFVPGNREIVVYCQQELTVFQAFSTLDDINGIVCGL